MKKTIVSTIFALLMVLVITLFAFTPAFADPPEKYTIPIDNWEYLEGSDSPCDFDITFHEWGEFRGLIWLDENGQMTRNFESFGQLRFEFLANGKSLSGNEQGPIHGYFSEDIVTIHFLGTGIFVTIPGYGPVYGFAGQSIVTFTYNPETGEWEQTDGKLVGTDNHIHKGYLEAFCAYLSS